MGPMYLFSGSVSEALLRGVRELGPGYAFSFEPPQVDSRELALLPTSDPSLQPLSDLGRENPDAGAGGGGGGGLSGANEDGRSRRAQAAGKAPATAETAAEARKQLYLEALSGSLTPRILLAYNPSVWSGEYFLDNTPERNPVRWTDGGGGGGSRASPAGPWGGGMPARRQMIYSMAGSQAHVLIQPPSASNPALLGGGGAGYGQRRRHGATRGASSHRPDPAGGGRSRGWSGCSGWSGADDVPGGDEGERAAPVRPRRRPGHMHATRLPGTRECVTRDVRDALDCLGGLKVLLPLFAQYDHGVRRGGGGAAAAAAARAVSYRTDPRLNETVLALLAETLRDRCVWRQLCEYVRPKVLRSLSNSSAERRSSGFLVLGWCRCRRVADPDEGVGLCVFFIRGVAAPWSCGISPGTYHHRVVFGA